MSGQKLSKELWTNLTRNHCEDILNSKQQEKENMVAWYNFAVYHKSDSKSHYFVLVFA